MFFLPPLRHHYEQLKTASAYSLSEEIVNTATHGLGLPIVLWVIGKGVAYIMGAVLYSFKRVPYIHSVFHVFVILGDICHMVATWKMLQLFL